ncbi:MAG: UvrD-helicase domain-containing protein [Chloroflexi bacterium]|nr:UvrD-helicase domain-containing protein [Chloroflexota bacterium]
MESIDVAACPGSGKTTLLVAKLAILAEKWRYSTRGICVLSHTNAARNTIETGLGNTNAGRCLLSYPHFIGTIHSFVNEFMALPWLRSKGYPIKMIDTDICLKRRWCALPYKFRTALENNRYGASVLSITSPDFCVGTVRWGKGRVLDTNTPTYKAIRETCRSSTEEGYFCFDELFVWANDLLNKVPGLADVLRSRFPLLFVDEAQDNSEKQSAILHRAFMASVDPVIRQRFGDENQAIFDSISSKQASTDKFPDGGIKKDLPNSHRFGQKIADLADPLGIVHYHLQGQGPYRSFASGVPEAQHTIYLFDDDNAERVIQVYADLLMETFSEQELLEGAFTAVGHIHRPLDNQDPNKFPHDVGHYWADYDPELTNQDPKPRTFLQYVLAGVGKAQTTGEIYWVVEKIAEGILRLAGMTQAGKILSRRRHGHRYVLELLDGNAEVRSRYENLIAGFAVERATVTQQTWEGRCRGVVKEICEAIAGVVLASPEVNDFLAWKDPTGDPTAPPTTRTHHDNIYRFSKNGKTVAIQIGSIHSVKGKTHTATLVLETFWHDHNLARLIPWLDGSRNGWKNSDGSQQESRLKLHYVAMTRPTHLLCLAMKRSAFLDGSGNLDQNLVPKLERHGWQVRML